MQAEITTINLGKAGLTEGVITSIKQRLRQKKIVKVKFLPSVMREKDKKEIAQDIARSVGGKIVKQVGFTVVVQK